MEAWFLERGTEKNQDDGGHRDTLCMRVHVTGAGGWLLRFFWVNRDESKVQQGTCYVMNEEASTP